jgi:hypothetical protein
MYFSIRIRTIFAVAGSLAILPECNAMTMKKQIQMEFNPLEDDTSSACGGLELVSAFVTGVSLFASAILVFV